MRANEDRQVLSKSTSTKSFETSKKYATEMSATEHSVTFTV